MIERPELTKNYPAIDGIAKPDRNHRMVEGVGGVSQVFKRAQEPIRPDVLAYVSDDYFLETATEARNKIEEEIRTLELIGGIPRLDSGTTPTTIGSYSVIRSRFTALVEALDNIKKLEQLYYRLRNADMLLR